MQTNKNNWTTIVSPTPTISSVNLRGEEYTIKDSVSHYLNLHGLREYDRRIKEYIDKRIDKKIKILCGSTGTN